MHLFWTLSGLFSHWDYLRVAVRAGNVNSAREAPTRAFARHTRVGERKFGDIPPTRQLARQACLRANHADGDKRGFSGFVATDFAVFAQDTPLATVANDAEEAGFRWVDVLRQHRIRRFCFWRMVRSLPADDDFPVMSVWLDCDCHVSVVFCRHLNQWRVKNLFPMIGSVQEKGPHRCGPFNWWAV